MPSSCAVFGCFNNYKTPGVKLCRFPPDGTIYRKKWLLATRRKDEFNVNKALVCSIHFEEEDFNLNRTSKSRLLKETAVPTKFLPVDDKMIDIGRTRKSKMLTVEEVLEKQIMLQDEEDVSYSFETDVPSAATPSIILEYDHPNPIVEYDHPNQFPEEDEEEEEEYDHPSQFPEEDEEEEEDYDHPNPIAEDYHPNQSSEKEDSLQKQLDDTRALNRELQMSLSEANHTIDSLKKEIEFLKLKMSKNDEILDKLFTPGQKRALQNACSLLSR